MMKFAVIGDPIIHSKSPEIHSAILDMIGIEHSYEKINVKKGGLPNFLAYAKINNINGFNVTMPHKTDITEYLDVISDGAKINRSVNTVKINGSGTYGHSTDSEGFLYSLEDNGFDISGKNIVILGAGGAVSTVAAGIGLRDAKSLSILGRTVEKAALICNRVANLCKNNNITRTEYFFGPIGNVSDYMPKADIIINATPLGMSGYEEDFGDLSFLSLPFKRCVVCDLIYEPAETRFLSEAKRLGHLTLNGYGMLIYQAILAQEFFLGMKLDRKKIYSIVESKIKGSR